MQLKIFLTFFFTAILFLVGAAIRGKSKKETRKRIIYLSIIIALIAVSFLFNLLNTILIIILIVKSIIGYDLSDSLGFWEIFMTISSYAMDVLLFFPSIKDLRKEHSKILKHELNFEKVKITTSGVTDISKTKKKINIVFTEPNTILTTQYNIIPQQVKIYSCMYPDIFEGIFEQEYEKIIAKTDTEWVFKELISELPAKYSSYTKIKNENLNFSLSFEEESSKIQWIVNEKDWLKNDTDTLIIELKYIIVKKKRIKSKTLTKIVTDIHKQKCSLSSFKRDRKIDFNIFLSK